LQEGVTDNSYQITVIKYQISETLKQLTDIKYQISETRVWTWVAGYALRGGTGVAGNVGAGFKPALPRPAPRSGARAKPAPSLRSTGTLAIRRALQVRSNPVPGGQHTYVTLPALDCRAPKRPTYRKCGGARNDGQGEALPCPGALRRDGGRGLRRARRGKPPRRYAVRSLPRGEWTRPRTARVQPPPLRRHPLLRRGQGWGAPPTTLVQTKRG
jgi:hypothetical protein